MKCRPWRGIRTARAAGARCSKVGLCPATGRQAGACVSRIRSCSCFLALGYVGFGVAETVSLLAAHRCSHGQLLCHTRSLDSQPPPWWSQALVSYEMTTMLQSSELAGPGRPNRDPNHDTVVMPSSRRRPQPEAIERREPRLGRATDPWATDGSFIVGDHPAGSASDTAVSSVPPPPLPPTPTLASQTAALVLSADSKGAAPASTFV